MANIKSIDGLPFGSIKSVDGLAAASVKSVNGVLGGWTGPWDDLYNAAGTDTPEFCWFFDYSFLSLISGDIAAVACAWSSGHDLSQPTAGYRPHWNAGTALAEFVATESDSMIADFSAPLANAARTFVWGENNLAVSRDVRFDSQTGRLVLGATSSGDKWRLYSASTEYDTGDIMTLGSQYHAVVVAPSYLWRRDGVELMSGSGLTTTAIGSNTVLGRHFDNLGTYNMDSNFKVFASYAGSTDYAAYETILASMKTAGDY